MTKLKAKIMNDDSWRKVAADKVLQGLGTQPLHSYLDRSKVSVSVWVASCPILKVCSREMGYEGGGKLWKPWRRQAAEEKQLRVTLEEISEVARERRRKEYGRRGRGDGGEEGEVTARNGLGRGTRVSV